MADAAIIPTQTQIASVESPAEEFRRKSKSENTLRAYRSDWADFTAWCAEHVVRPLPASPGTVADYLAAMANSTKYKYATIARRMASISKAHQAAGHASPTQTPFVRDTLQGIGRTLTTSKARAVPLRIRDIRRIVYALPHSLAGNRDRALLLVGYIMAGRRSEVVALNVEDIAFVPEGMRLTIRWSKTDQTGKGEIFDIRYSRKDPAMCPVRALRAWIEAAGILKGPIFRAVTRHGEVQPWRLSDKAVERIIRKYAPECGGHSLRAGFVTDQYAIGRQEAVIMARSRHKSLAVLATYRREADAFSVDYLDDVL